MVTTKGIFHETSLTELLRDVDSYCGNDKLSLAEFKPQNRDAVSTSVDLSQLDLKTSIRPSKVSVVSVGATTSNVAIIRGRIGEYRWTSCLTLVHQCC